MAIRNGLALFVSIACANAGLPTAPASVANRHDVPEGSAVQAAAVELPAGVSEDWWTRVQRDIRQSEYHVTWQEQPAPSDALTSPGRASVAGYQAPNRAHDFRTFFTTEGIRIVQRTTSDEGGDFSRWEWGLTLTAYGETPVAPAQLSVSDNRIEYRRGDLTEWYVNDERGLEQGFTLSAPPQPAGSTPSPIILEMAVVRDLTSSWSADRSAIEFSPAGDEPVVRYGGLLVHDATLRSSPGEGTRVKLCLPIA